MPMNMGLSSAEERDFEALLCSHHDIDILLQVMDLSHKTIGEAISARLLDGQVTVDCDADITRAVDMDLLDPTGALHLDSNSPDDGAMFADRMIQIKYDVVNPLGTKRYSCPIFTGPLTKLERTGAIVKVEAQGKEIFGLSPAWNDRTFKKGLRVTTAISQIVGEMMGELDSKMSIPNLRKKLPRNVSVGGDKLPWEVAKQLAASIGYLLFYDGNGVCQMRKMPRGVVFHFKGGAGGSLESGTDVGFSIERVINAVEVWGKKPTKAQRKRGKKRPHARAVAPRNHPLSPYWPEGLGRPNGPRFLPQVVESDSIENDREAKALANRLLRSGLLESVDVAYDAVTIPHLQEMEVVKVSTEKFTGNHRLRKFAIGLTASASMPVGYVRNVKPNRSRIRVKDKTTPPKRRRSRRRVSQ